MKAPVRQEWIHFIKRTRVEPLLFGFNMAIAVRYIAVQQMLQDKICIETYHESNNYCHYLSKQADSVEKEDILAEVSTYLSYREFVTIIPCIFSALMVGSWCDRFPNGKRYCMLSCCFAQLLETTLLLMNAINFYADPKWTILSFLPTSVFGNEFAFYTTVYGYIATNIKPSERAFRYILLAVFRNLSQSVGFYIGGQILKMEHPFLSGDQIQNYAGTFILSLAWSVFVIGWTFAFIWPPPPGDAMDEVTKSTSDADQFTDNKCSSSFEASVNMTSFPINGYSRDNLIEAVNEEELERESTAETGNKLQTTPVVGFRAKISDLLGFKNLHNIWVTAVKRRPGTARMRMWLIVLTINLTQLPEFGKSAVIYPMSEKVYGWDSETYSNVTTLRYLVQIVSTLVAIPFLFKFFTLNDMQTAIIGVVSGIVGDSLIGSITAPIGFFLWLSMASLAGISGTGCRAYLSKLLPKSDVTQIFSVTSTFEAIGQCVGTYLFTLLFGLTIHSYPTFVFHFMGVILFFALGTIIWVDIKTPYDKSVRAKAVALARTRDSQLQSIDLTSER